MDRTASAPPPAAPAARRRHLDPRVPVLGLVLLTTLGAYTLLHEGGHALAALLAGGHLTAFDILGLGAHVAYDGTFTEATRAAVSLAGPLLPVAAVVVLLVAARRRGDPVLEWTKLLAGIAVGGSLATWAVMPWLFLAGGRPADDSVTFLLATGIAPPVVSLAALGVLGVVVALVVRGAGGAAGAREALRAPEAAFRTPRVRRTTTALAGGLVALVAAAAGLGALGGSGQRAFLAAPDGYVATATVALSERARDGEVVDAFTLASPGPVGLHMAVQGLERGPFALVLAGPGGQGATLFSDGPAASGTFVVRPSLDLAAGRWEVRLTSPAGPGTLVVSRRMPP